MSHFIVTFRLKSDSTYGDRYSSLTNAVYAIGGGVGGVWEETSSFFAFKATGTAAGICNKLYIDSDFSISKDQMLVIDLDSREKATLGEVKYLTMLETALGF